MNVAFDDWIPVVTTAGKRQLASLCEVLTGGEQFVDLAVRPHERVALMRLFLCVAHAAIEGPKDYDEWRNVPSILPAKAKQYLATWKDSFELFHPEKPWLQVAGLKNIEKNGSSSGKTSPVALLDTELATGNNSTLFDHQGMAESRQIEPTRTALNLLTFQNFSPGGGAPVAQWKTKKTAQVGNPDAPCLSQSMSHCLFRGKDLTETIHLNMPTYECIELVYRSFKGDKRKGDVFSVVDCGRPVWERFPSSPGDSAQIENATKTYVGRLVPVSRWIRLIEGTDQMYCCNGFKYDTYKDGFPAEPTAAVRVVTKRDKKGVQTKERKVVGINPNRAIWRELSALLLIRSAEGLGGPLAMENASDDMEYDFHVCAMTRAQASMDIGVESVFHIFPAFQSNLATYRDEVEQAEDISRQLRGGIEVYRNAIDKDWTPRVKRTQAKEQSKLKDRLAQTAFLSFWTTVEKNLPLLMAHIEAIGTENTVPTCDTWRKMLFCAACDAYRTACGQETPRQVRAFAEGWRRLVNQKDKTESLEKEDEV